MAESNYETIMQESLNTPREDKDEYVEDNEYDKNSIRKKNVSFMSDSEMMEKTSNL